MRFLLIGLSLLGSEEMLAFDRTTPISFSSKSGQTFRFNTHYSIPYGDSEGFLLGVANQRSLGAFLQTNVSQTDEFEDAVKKRLAEYAALSSELEGDLKKPLPTISTPQIKMVRFNTPITTGGGTGSVKSPWEYSSEAVDGQLADVERNLSGENKALGLSGFTSLKVVMENNPKSAHLTSARDRLTKIEQKFFTRGLLRANELSDLSSAISVETSQGKFLINALNQCIVRSACDPLSMRVLVANLDLFATAKELPGIGTKLVQNGFALNDVEGALSIVSGLTSLSKLSSCTEIDCGDARAFYIQNLVQKYKIPETIANVSADTVIKSKENTP